MRIEDDVAFRRKHSNDKKSLSVKKPGFKTKGPTKSETARQISNVRFEKGKLSGKTPQPPKLSSYDFTGTPKDLVESLKGIQATVRWPKKTDKTDDSRDRSKWCDFHDDYGHLTEDCITLRRELAYLSSKGHLKDIVKDNVSSVKST